MKKRIFKKVVLILLQIIFIAQAVLGIVCVTVFILSDVDKFLQIVAFIISKHNTAVMGVFIFNLFIRTAIKTVLDLNIKTSLRIATEFFYLRTHGLIFELCVIGLVLLIVIPILGYILSVFIVCFCMIWTDENSKELVKRIQKSTP